MVHAFLNTDNAEQNNCCMKAYACVGPNQEGEEKTLFDVDLPNQEGSCCSSVISIAHMRYTPPSRVEARIYPAIYPLYAHLDNVTIPGGFSLAHAMTCMALASALGMSLDTAEYAVENSPRKRRSLVRD
jgi:hypothetical protein